MRTKFLILLSVILSLSLVAAPSNAAVKAGAKCTKAGATATASGKKFTCVKSGTRLVWNKGVAVKAAPKPQVVPAVPPTVTPPQPEQKVEAKISFALDPRITQRADLTAVEMCRTADQTPDTRPEGIVVHRNGFPRPINSLYGKKTARILVIPMSFNDLPFRAESNPSRPNTKSDLEALKEVIPNVKDAFKKASAGRFEIEIDVLPQSEWWIFNQNIPVVIGAQINNFPKIMDLVATQKSTFKFDVYDSYIFISGVGVPGQPGIGAGQAQFGEKNKNGKNL